MHYANDNAVVKAIYDFTHGPQRRAIIGIVVALVLVSLYFPVRDLYVAKRSSDIWPSRSRFVSNTMMSCKKASTSCSQRRVSRTRRPRTWAW